MANPQPDEFTRISNEILHALMMTDLTGREFRLVLLIIRKTYGFHKKDAAIALSVMSRETGLHKVNCSQVVKALEQKKVITVTEYSNGLGKSYRFNKNYEEWRPLPKAVTVTEGSNRYRRQLPPVTVDGNGPLPNLEIDSILDIKENFKESIKEREPLPKAVTPEKGKNGIPYASIIEDLNKKSGKHFRPIDSTKTLIKARFHQGFTEEDFQRVHDNMTAKWKNNPKMNQYLRPATLYRESKFEGYLNNKVGLNDRGICSMKTEKGMQAFDRFMNEEEEEKTDAQ
jgi:phage replication O-like protein O